jgi:hypothetical protein
MEMQQKGPLFSMFNRIGLLCVSLYFFIYLFFPSRQMGLLDLVV